MIGHITKAIASLVNQVAKVGNGLRIGEKGT